jgi:ABC-type glycerol-3-phosphate transport system substrate-binding protein
MKRSLRIGIGLGTMLGAAVLLAACGGGKGGSAGSAHTALSDANMVYYTMPG